MERGGSRGDARSAPPDQIIPGAKRRFPYVSFLIAVLVIGAVLASFRYAKASKLDVEFLTAEVEKGSVTASVSATGTLESTTTVTVGSQVSGPVRQVLVDFNSPVRVGQVLALLDPSEFEARVRESEAGLELARADLENSNAKVQTAKSSLARAETAIAGARAALSRAQSSVDSGMAAVDQAQHQITRSRAEMENALMQYKRFEQLYKRQLVAASERDSAHTAYRVAAAVYENSLSAKLGSVAALRQLQAQLEGAKSDVQTAMAQRQAALAEMQAAQAQVGSSLARVRQATASVEKARVDLKRSTIRSPIDGTVINRKVEPGQTVTASFNTPELFTIAKDLHQMQVRADVSEADIGKVTLGQKVTFTVDAYPDEKFEGKVIQVRSAPINSGGGVQNNVVIYGVLISAPNPKLLLKPGMTATVSIAAEELKNVLLVPDEALRFLPPNPPDPEEEKKKREKKSGGDRKKKKVVGKPGVVWVEGADGLPERRDLILGVGDGKVTEVRDGDIKEHDKVYTKILDEDKLKKKGFRISF